MKYFVLGCLLTFAIGTALGIALSPHRMIVDARDGVVAFADGTAQISVADDVPDQVMHIYRAAAEALGDAPHYRTPSLIYQGGAWQRMAYTYDDPESESCHRNIFFVDRVNKQVTQSRVDYCIQQNATLDEHDITHFFAVSPDAAGIAVGTYENGAIIASHAVPERMMYWERAFSWDLTRAIITFISADDCGPDAECAAQQPKPQAYYWNLQTGEWREIDIPQYTTPVDLENTHFVYNPDTDTFAYAARLIVGTTTTATPSTVDKITPVE